MSRIALLSAILSLLFFAACDDPEPEDKFPQGSLYGKCYDDGTCNEGLVCIENVCFNDILNDEDDLPDDLIDEEPEGEDADTKDTDMKEADADKVDIDQPETDIEPDGDGPEPDGADTEAEPDDDLIVDPCDPDPCGEMEHSDGECTVDGDSYICGCDENYSWDADDKLCAADTRRTDCAATPPLNAHFSGGNADGKFEQLWSGSEWLPATFDCAWECDTDFALEEGSCIHEKTVPCDTDNGNPANSADVAADVTVHYTTDGGWEAAADCAWECDDDFALEGGACLDSKQVPCDTDNGNPSNSHDVVVDVTVTYTDAGGWTDPADCAWACDTNYTLSGGGDACVADTRRADCTNIPANAHGTGANSDGKLDQTWDGDSWEPGDDTCTWTCDADHALEGGACIDEKQVACDSDNGNPLNSHDVTADVTVTYTDLGGWSDPADCAWACDTDFALEGGACIDEKLVPCDADNANPLNSHDVVADVTVAYTTAGGWTAPADCAWECNDDFAPEGGACINSKEVPCDTDNANPANSHDVSADVTVTYTDLGGWSDPADCVWACDTNYTVNGGGDACVADTRRSDCQNIPLYAHGNGANSDGKFEQTWDGDSWEPATFVCTWECDLNYSQNGDICEPDTQRADCTNTLPEDAHWSGDNADGKFEQTWSGSAWLPATFDCAFACDANYTWDGDSCEADSRRTYCANIPANAHGVGDNADGKFEQVWDGNTWTPDTFFCAWECDLNYTKNGELCDADTRREDCTNILPGDAHWIAPNADGKFDQTWDGDSWEPATHDCAFACDTNYTWDGDSCEPDTRRNDCSNTLPGDAHWTGDNADGKFEQTWSGAEWLPDVFVCAWECDATYHQVGEDTCDPDEINEACTNTLPDDAHWSDTGVYPGDGTVTRTWDGDSYEPQTDSCPWACDADFHKNGEVCDPDVIISDCTNELPTNGVWSASGAYLGDGTVEQTWDGDSYEPGVDNCPWECDPHYPYNELLDECVFQPIVYVDLNATGEETGYSWADAFTDISEAVNFAMAGQEVWVAQGTYYPTMCTTNWERCDDEPGNLRLYNFTLKADVAIYGGFDGTETARGERDWATNITILSADLNGDDAWDDVAKTWLNRTDNTHHVIANFPDEDLDEDAIIDGFTITGGQADSAPYNTGGGGITFGAGDTPTIRNCVFTGNTALDGGGAIMAYETSVAVEDCAFDRNISKDGGAISVASVGTTFSLTVDRCTFTGNRTVAPDSNQRGGAISVNGDLTVTDSDFIGNHSPKEGAAISTAQGTTVIIDNCLFDQNMDDGSGKGNVVRMQSGTITVSDSVFTDNTGIPLRVRDTVAAVTGTRFEGNTVVNSGAIEAPTSDLTVENCRFIDNHAVLPGSGFAGLAGAIFINGRYDDGTPSGAVVTIANSEFRNNTANLWGGAILQIYSNPTITNCTFDGNTDGGNDAIVFAESHAIINNTILWGEVRQIVGPVGPYTFAASVPVFTNSDVYQSGGSAMTCGDGDDSCWVLPFGTDGGGNIDADPLFVGSGADPLDLQGGSPCVDSGSNTLVPAWLTTDILGDARIQNTSVDMGAYER